MKSLFRPFPLPLTGKQWFYLGILQGLGAGFIDGGANFGIAYAMYHNQKVVKMWIFSQNTIAGDLGVTPIIQCLASMLITSTLVHTDLHNKAISPLPFVYPHVENLPDPRSLFYKSTPSQNGQTITEKNSTPTTDPISAESSNSTTSASMTVRKKGFIYYYWMLVRFIFEGTENNMLLERVGVWPWLGRLIWTAAQGAAIGIVFGFPIWCLAIVILGPIYKMDDMGSKWAPQVIKLVYGAIVGWVTNPVIAILALGSQAENHLLVVPADEEAGMARSAAGVSAPAIAVDRISEEQETLVDDRQQQFVSPTTSRGKGNKTAHLTLPTPDKTQFDPSNSPRRVPSSPTISLRPPLTANVSNLAPLPTPLPQTAPPQGSFYTNNPTNNITGGMTRPRGDSTGSFTYSLGGSGGRAQRSRAGSRASIPTLPLATPNVKDQEDREMGDGGSGNLFGFNPASASGPGTQPGRIRAGSSPVRRFRTLDRSTGVDGGLGTVSGMGTGTSTGAGTDNLAPPVWDVFGRRDGAPPPPPGLTPVADGSAGQP